MHSGAPEWYCSSLCRETETLCQDIYERSYTGFISDATANGLILMKLPETWSTNEKMFASGGQGHGFAAERGNHIVDRVRLKNARILGENNARNGADRLVSGTEIQTKYCSTAARSVGAAFDGQNGQYRYMGNNGPMQLEVPRDQYAGAVETMRNKIREGKVPGVTDPAEASRLIRRGHLTYTQARNITRFGTIESVTYDIAEGSVVSLAAGGISFALTASVFWLSTGDRDAALQTAAVQAGKTFTRTLAVYVTTQQLHRLSVVQGMLKHIDFSTASSTVRLALQKGTSAGNISALNKVMKPPSIHQFKSEGIDEGLQHGIAFYHSRKDHLRRVLHQQEVGYVQSLTALSVGRNLLQQVGAGGTPADGSQHRQPLPPFLCRLKVGKEDDLPTAQYRAHCKTTLLQLAAHRFIVACRYPVVSPSCQ